MGVCRDGGKMQLGQDQLGDELRVETSVLLLLMCSSGFTVVHHLSHDWSVHLPFELKGYLYIIHLVSRCCMGR